MAHLPTLVVCGSSSSLPSLAANDQSARASSCRSGTRSACVMESREELAGLGTRLSSGEGVPSLNMVVQLSP